MASPHSKHKKVRDTRPLHRRQRLESTRVQKALTEAREHQAQLEARIKLEQAQAAVTEFYKRPEVVSPKPVAERREAESATALIQKRIELQSEFELQKAREKKRSQWSLGQARSMYRQGYTLEHCIEMTGWDAEWFDGALEVQQIAYGNR